MLPTGSLSAGKALMTTDDMQKFGKESMDMAMTSFGAWTKNTQAIATEVSNYSRRSLEGVAAGWQKLASAKSLERAMEVQNGCLTSSCEDLVAEASHQLGELCLDLAREAYTPFEGMLGKASGMK